MDKPISIIIEETKKQLVETLNQSGLPVCILEMIIGNIYTEVKSLAQTAYIKDVENYNNSIEPTGENQ